MPPKPNPIPAVGDVIHYLDENSKPTTNSSTISSVGPHDATDKLFFVYDAKEQSVFVKRARTRDRLADGKPVWLEFYEA